MKHPFLIGLLTVLSVTSSLFAGKRDADWKEVESAIAQRLPKTAIERLDTIITAAIADNAYAEAIKAIGQKISLGNQIQGGKAEEKIVRFQAELEKAPSAMKPMMEAILANWYWQYFQQNRWRFLQRTQTAGAAGSDIQTWDLVRILGEIDRHFTAALAHDEVLKTTPIHEYDALLEGGTAPDVYRPTLYDFLTYNALQFYQTGEQGGIAAEDDFELSADGPVFGSSTEFENWQPETPEVVPPKLKAVKLYQALLRFHQADADRSAFYDADLVRLTFGHAVAVGENKEARYNAALENFIQSTTQHEIVARSLAALATQFEAVGELAKAKELAQRGYGAYPKSEGGILCFNIISRTEAKSAELDTEEVWNAPWPTLNVTYRNVTKVYFRAIAVNFNDYIGQARRRAFGTDSTQLEELLGKKPTLEWSADLPPTNDYRLRTERLAAPTSLPAGFYFILSSHEQSFKQTDNQISVKTVWVSDLALVIRTRSDDPVQSGLVLRAGSGEPLAGAMVRLWQRDRDGGLSPLTPTQTNENGQFSFSAKNQTVLVVAEYDGQAVSSKNDIFCYNNRAVERTTSQTVFFTDRALYRPGQTINYKGVSIRSDQDGGKYSALAGLHLTVVFSDPNGREITRATHVTNEYGSFSGVFTAPRDRLMGRMRIQVLGKPSMAFLNVEEYKRPKFQVELQPPAGAGKLDEMVSITGKAMAYTGSAIGGAKVTWRVERAVQLPSWCWWWQPTKTQAIAHGTALTAADGTFQVQFPAVPDRAVPVKNEPTFDFTVHADVTDTTGETRSSEKRLVFGYTGLQASLGVDPWQTSEKPIEFSIATTSLDGDPQTANGTLTIHALKQPATVERSPLQQTGWWRSSGDEPKADPTNPDSWELGDVIAENAFKTDAKGKAQIDLPLKEGIYRASVKTQDRSGQTVTARQTVQVVAPRDPHYGVKIPNHFASPKWSVEPGEKFAALWGTGYKTGRAFVEVECNGKSLKSYWTAPDRTQEIVVQTVTEEMRGGFTVRITYVRENRAYINQRVVDVPWSNKQLTVKWESFRSKLIPGQKETWTAVVTGPDAKSTAAEMVAALYDASLDQFFPHSWPQAFNVFRKEFSRITSDFQNAVSSFQAMRYWETPPQQISNWRYRTLPPAILGSETEDNFVVLSPFSVAARGGGGAPRRAMAGARVEPPLSVVLAVPAAAPSPGNGYNSAAVDRTDATPASPKLDLSKISSRKNLNETAFFFPQLVAGDDGVVKMVFTMPEALTEWKFLGFVHDQQLRAGFLNDKVVTAKDLMVEPNPPRFLREGDVVEFTVKVSNQTDAPQAGTVKLSFTDTASQKPVDEALANSATEQPFNVPSKESRSYSWRIAVPDGMDFLTYKAVAATTKFSDGEEGFLPVLSRRVLVTESLPLPIRGKTTKEFVFKKLLDSGASSTLRQQSLTVQMVSHPAWYAVMALPYLMEYPYECSEQVFNRFYANALARHIARSDPKIRRVFDLWKATPALESPLEKNQDLKSVMIEETPWLRQANTESQARRNVGLLFEDNRLDEEAARALRTLSDRQLGNGFWSWFPGGPLSEYISLYITTGFGRLRHLGVDVDTQPATKSLAGLDAWMDERYREALKLKKPEDYLPSYTDALYLYGRSFFLKDQPIAPQHRQAVDFFLRQARAFWTKVNSRQSQAHLALALQRFGDKETPQAILKSLKERSITDEEFGMFWRDPDVSGWWYNAPIESQAIMIEAFAEVTHDTQAVEDCKVWLLKQKQTQDWRTTKATADAIYSLLLRGSDLLASDERVEVSLGGAPLTPEKSEAGTGFYEQKFIRNEIKPSMGQINVTKTDDGVSWGSVSWQYLEDIGKITPHEGTPLKVKKTLFIKDTTSRGQGLRPVTGPVSVGDELVVRIELRTDRDMEFVHLKDQRGSGTEPVNVLSRYKYQDGLAYYETTRDTASHFFIDRLPRGVYVFEYSTRIQLKGHYQTGLAEVQCMYAPEFNSHSESIPLIVE